VVGYRGDCDTKEQNLPPCYSEKSPVRTTRREQIYLESIVTRGNIG